MPSPMCLASVLPWLAAGPRRSATLVATVAAASLAGCGGPALPAFPPACPKVAILSDGADLTAFRGTGTDLTDMVTDARITGLAPGAKCALDDLTHLRTSLAVNMEVVHGPAATSQQATVPFFISVSRGDTILDEQDQRVNVRFPPNAERLAITSEPRDVVLPVTDAVPGSAYTILVSFRLTPQQLAFNRRRGPR